MSIDNFNKDEYNSGNGMLTYIWGPALWHFLHTISFNYPIHPTLTDKKKYNNFLLSLRDILPCKYCRDNFMNNLETIQLRKEDFDNRDSFSRMIYKLHNEVNRGLEKTIKLSYNQVKNNYENLRARCNMVDLRKTDTTEKGCTEPMNKNVKHKCKLSIIKLTNDSEKQDSICFPKQFK